MGKCSGAGQGTAGHIMWGIVVEWDRARVAI